MLADAAVSVEELRSRSGWFLGLGIVLIVLGIIALGLTELTTIVSVLVLGWFLVISGVVEGINAFRNRNSGGFLLNLLAGLLGVVVGLMFVSHPVAGALALTLLLGAFFLVEGIFRIVGAVRLGVPHRGWMALGGAITGLLGVLLLVQWPSSALWFIGLAVGVDMIFRGWAWLMLAIIVRRSRALVGQAAAT